MPVQRKHVPNLVEVPVYHSMVLDKSPRLGLREEDDVLVVCVEYLSA